MGKYVPGFRCSGCGVTFKTLTEFELHRTGKYVQGQFKQPYRKCKPAKKEKAA